MLLTPTPLWFNFRDLGISPANSVFSLRISDDDKMTFEWSMFLRGSMLFLSFFAECSFFISHLLEQIAATLEIPLVPYEVQEAGIPSSRFCMFYTHLHSCRQEEEEE